jgi:hypothetical protein
MVGTAEGTMLGGSDGMTVGIAVAAIAFTTTSSTRLLVEPLLEANCKFILELDAMKLVVKY